MIFTGIGSQPPQDRRSRHMTTFQRCIELTHSIPLLTNPIEMNCTIPTISYPSYRYFVRQNAKLLELWQTKKGKGWISTVYLRTKMGDTQRRLLGFFFNPSLEGGFPLLLLFLSGMLLPCFIHNMFGYSLSYGISKLLHMKEQDCRTIALEVGMQNGGSFMVAKKNTGRISGQLRY